MANDLDTLRTIEDRVLWLSIAMINHANRVRTNPTGMKVGGHQASSASLVSIMTSLWFEQLTADDRVSVKPHASPVLHAINYLLGELDEKYLTTLREFGGLQSYPSRTKDPDPADYSTGSVGIGATAPIWGAIARRYVDGHFGGAGTGRQYSLLGDAELDEGACWEAILDPQVRHLGEIVWVVDFNRQSLDRVVPELGGTRLAGMFAAAGWQVITVKYGRLLEDLFTRAGGAALRARIDEMTNPEYQRLLRCTPAQVRDRLPGDGPGNGAIRTLLAGLDDATVHAAVRNLGGHDLATLRQAWAEIDDSRPSVIFAYTVKGYGLATEGHPQNHSSLLTAAQLGELAGRVGADVDRPWQGFGPDSAAGRLCAETADRLRRTPPTPVTVADVPADFGRTPQGTTTTQAALGRALMDLSREAPEVGGRVVTLSPDVSSSTNLGGWLNKVGVWSPEEEGRDWFADDAETILLEWCLLAALARLGRPDGRSAYLRLSSRPVDQKLADVPTDPAARALRRRQVVTGGYALRRHDRPSVTIAAMGAVVTEALEAAARLDEMGVGTDVLCLTSPGLLFEAVQSRRGLGDAPSAVLDSLFPARRATPLVTVLDGHPHTLAFLAGTHQVPATHLGVSRFGQAGDLDAVYRHHGLDTDSIVAAALDLAK